MDAQPIHYVTTPDGYSIAYSASGSGRPLVFLPTGLHHLQLVRRYDLRISEWLTQLASKFRLVQYDSRGQGMSTRHLPPDHSIEDLEIDLEAVVDELQLERFVLFGYFYKAHVAVRYAIKHPDRVEALVLASCSTSMQAWPLHSLVGLAEHNWEGMLHNWVPATFTPPQREELINYFKAARNAQEWLISARAFSVSDIGHELSLLQTPTLVIHPRDFIWLPPEESMKVAAGIPNARFVLTDGLLPLGDASHGLAAIERFLQDLQASNPQPHQAQPDDERLSHRQMTVLRLIAEGRTTREIAETLVLSERTVERHIAEIYLKIGARNRAEATAYVFNRQSGA
jgi:pimeloyl-ACP methyl ester carboxylesterase